MTEVVQTSPQTIRSIKNLRGTAPDLTSGTFVYRTNSYVFKSPDGTFLYYSLGNISKKLRESPGNFFTLPNRPPLIEDGLVLLSNKAVLFISADDIIRGRVYKKNLLTTEELKVFIYGTRDSSNSGTSGSEELGFDTAPLQIEDIEGSGETLGAEECSAADLALEEQIQTLFFAKNPQALRGIADFAHSRQIIEGSPIQDSD